MSDDRFVTCEGEKGCEGEGQKVVNYILISFNKCWRFMRSCVFLDAMSEMVELLGGACGIM